MDSPNLPTPAKSSKTNSAKILCIIISEATVQALHLEISKLGIEILSQSRAVAYTDPKQCVIQVDQCLAELDKSSENVNKVVFALNHAWIKDGNITDEYKPLLRNITTELSLEALGFIDETESIAQYLQNQESSFSGLVIAVGVTTLSFAQVVEGKRNQFESVGRSDNFRSDTIEGLSRFSNDALNANQYLPANIILASFDSNESDLEDFKQELLSAEFDPSIRFLQTPVVRTLSDQQYLTIISGGAGKAVAIASGVKESIALTPVLDGLATQSDDNPEDFGFQTVDPQNIDPTIAENPEEVLTYDTPAVTPESPDLPETAVDTDLTGGTTPATATSFGVPISTDLPDISKEVSSDNTDEAELDLFEDPEANASLSFGAKLAKAWKKPYQGKHGKIFFALTGLILGLIFVAIGLLSYVYTTATAVVTINFDKKPISKEAEIIIDSEIEESDPQNQTLSASTIEKTVSDKGSIPTTGVKIVGDKAKGSVIIFNKTTAVKKFNAGSTLKIGDLAFTLDEEVQVASASVEEKNGGAETKYGQAKATVTAGDIGADFNQEKEVKMTVSNFGTDTYEATVDKEGITGGASREVRIVAQEDANALVAELRNALIAKANEELVKEAQSGQYIVPTQNVTAQNPKFSFKVGDESDQLDLELEVTVSALTYTVEDLRPLVQHILGEEVPEGFELFDEDPQILTDNTPESTDSATVKKTLTASVSSFAVPKIDPESIKNEIGGQSIETASNTLKNRDSIAGIEVSFTPDWIKVIRKNIPNPDKVEIKTAVK